MPWMRSSPGYRVSRSMQDFDWCRRRRRYLSLWKAHNLFICWVGPGFVESFLYRPSTASGAQMTLIWLFQQCYTQAQPRSLHNLLIHLFVLFYFLSVSLTFGRITTLNVHYFWYAKAVPSTIPYTQLLSINDLDILFFQIVSSSHINNDKSHNDKNNIFLPSHTRSLLLW